MYSSKRCVNQALPRHFWLSLGLVLTLTLSGCGSIKLHSETRQKQGEHAKKAWGEIDLNAYFETERQNLAKVLAEEIESSRRLAAARRENAIQQLAFTPIDQLGKRFDKALLTLFDRKGAAIDATQMMTLESSLSTAQSAVRREQENSYQLERDHSFLKAMGVPIFSCPQLMADPAVDLKNWKATNQALASASEGRLESAKTFCIGLTSAQADLKHELGKVKGGSLQEAYLSWVGAEEAMEKRQGDVAERRKAYRDALKAYNEEVERATPDKAVTESVKEKAGNVASALQALEVLQSALGFQAASAERLDKINDLLANLQAGTEADVKTASKGELVAAMLPAIADNARAIGQANKGQNLVSLLIQRDIEQANLNAATVQVAIQKKDLALREAIVKASVVQAWTYVRARTFLNAVVSCNETVYGKDQVGACKAEAFSKSVHDAWATVPTKGRKTLLESTTLYLDALSRQQTDIDAMATQYLALERERTVELSQVHASMWQALIGASVDQAAEFAALGLKAVHFERLLHLIGIFYIGHGVNN